MTLNELIAWRFPHKKDRPASPESYYNALPIEDAVAANLLAVAVGLSKPSDLESLYFTLPVNYEQFLARRNDDNQIAAYARLEGVINSFLSGEKNPLEHPLPDDDERIAELDPIDEYLAKTIFEDAVSKKITVPMVQRAMKMGFYPMSSTMDGKSFLQVRFHGQKEIITWENFHVPHDTARFIRKYFADCTITCNRDFDGVVAGIKNAYEETWLTDELLDCYRQIHKNPGRFVSVDSIEIWRGDTLIAGEIGFVTGNVYASLSGFHTEKHSGTVQMAVLGLMLMFSGFLYWDLGMYIPYKERYGAVLCNRDVQQGLWEQRKKTRVALPGPDVAPTLNEWLGSVEQWILMQKERDAAYAEAEAEAMAESEQTDDGLTDGNQAAAEQTDGTQAEGGQADRTQAGEE